VATTIPPHPFQVNVDDRGQVVVIHVQGEVDAATAPRVGDAVNRLLVRGRQVVLELSEVDFMDLHGLAVMLRATRRARADGGSFSISSPAPCVRRLVELVHAERDLTIVSDGYNEPLDVA
jgi:anti-sigma B factor antagonist